MTLLATGHEEQMNNFRSNYLSGAKLGIASPLVTSKKKSSAANRDSLASVEVPRSETRTVNHRDGDRHRLADERVAIRHGATLCKAQLVNLSSSGAMIIAPIAPNLWDRIDLRFDKSTRIEAAVVWIRDGRIGLEFAHETGLHCAPALRDEVLRKVLDRHFPDLRDEPEQPATAGDQASEIELAPREHRHPLIFSADVHFDHDSSKASLRNVSAKGALIETERSFAVGSEILLDLGEAGSVFAKVSWSRGDKCGVRFREPFDIARLATARTELVRARPAAADRSRAAIGESSPWASHWQRASLSELHRKLS